MIRISVKGGIANYGRKQRMCHETRVDGGFGEFPHSFGMERTSVSDISPRRRDSGMRSLTKGLRFMPRFFLGTPNKQANEVSRGKRKRREKKTKHERKNLRSTIFIDQTKLHKPRYSHLFNSRSNICTSSLNSQNRKASL